MTTMYTYTNGTLQNNAQHWTGSHNSADNCEISGKS